MYEVSIIVTCVSENKETHYGNFLLMSVILSLDPPTHESFKLRFEGVNKVNMASNISYVFRVDAEQVFKILTLI